MTRLTRPQRGILLAFLLLAVNGLLRSAAFNEPIEEEKVPNVDNGTIAVTCSEENPASLYVPVGELEALRRDAALWRGHAWRAEVHLVMGYIRKHTGSAKAAHYLTFSRWVEDNANNVNGYEHLARAFVHIARKPSREQPDGLGIPLWVAVVIAERESGFDNLAVGQQGEKTLMQILPLPGRYHLIQDGLSDPALAIQGAMQNFFMPGYVSAGVRGGLKRYNASDKYVNEVMALGEKMVAECKLWAVGLDENI